MRRISRWVGGALLGLAALFAAAWPLSCYRCWAAILAPGERGYTFIVDQGQFLATNGTHRRWNRTTSLWSVTAHTPGTFRDYAYNTTGSQWHPGWFQIDTLVGLSYLLRAPIWGLAAFSAALGVVCWRWGSIVRSAAGLCPACGYDLCGSPPDGPTCPECGAERPT